MDRTAEDRVVRLALQSKSVTEADVERASFISTETGKAILDLLVESGCLDTATLESLIAEAGIEDDRPPVEGWDRYRILGHLGGGGMGSVFKAFDPRLDRHVAIKFIRGADPALARRFAEEARAQARVEHDRICKVYEVGEVEGHPFIAMQLIDGESLKKAAAAMTLEQKLLAIKEVAEGLHEAHRSGLIHRDIKPTNIMVARGADGRWKPFLMDFGLARAPESARVTQSGSIVGTPHYMSPEQARGGTHGLDRRSDVYSLGASLYHVLSGHPPFPENDLVTVLRRVQEDVPDSLRGPGSTVPVDVDAITQKCLRKDPDERYPSARALAEDLGRFLDGEPVEARPTTLRYRLRVKAAKHRIAVGVGAVALVLLVISASWGGYNRWTASRRARLAQAFGQQVERIEAVARYSYALPLHDVRPERDRIRRQMDEIRERMDEVGSLAVGPGHYALGRGHMALGDDTRALNQLEKAWGEGYREPPVVYALGRTLGSLYNEGLREAELLTDPEVRAARIAKIETTYRDPALRYLRRGEGVPAEASDFVQALIAQYEKRYDDALLGARAAYASAPWMYEAMQLEGIVHAAMAQDGRRSGDYAAALEDFRLAEQAYRSAAAVGRSDPAVHVGTCRLHATMMGFEIQDLGGDVTPHFESGLEACGRALEADPDDVEALTLSSRLYQRMGEHRRGAGGDPRELLDRAIESARKALAIRPEDAGAHQQIGAAFIDLAAFDQGRGEDPRPDLEEAAGAYEQAIALNPSDYNYNNLGVVLKNRGLYELNHGMDPRETLAGSVAAYRESLSINPNQVAANVNLGTAYSKIAGFEGARGDDPRESLEEAIRAFEAAGAVNPNHMIVHYNLGRVYSDLAFYEKQRGGDAEALLPKAVAAFRAAIDANPESSYVTHFRAALGGALHVLATIQMDTGRNPTPTLERAIEAYRDALAENPNNVHAHFNLAVSYAALADYRFERGEDPGESVDLALAAAGKAVELDPARFDAYDIMGKAHWIRGRFRLNAGLDPGFDIAAGNRDLEKASSLNPSGAFSPLGLGRLSLLEARWRIDQGLDPSAAFLRAADALELAEKNSSGSTDVLTTLAELHRWRALWQRAQGKSETGETDAGLELTKRALEQSPRDAEAMVGRAGLLLLRTESGSDDARAEAEELIEEALALNSNLERRCAELRAQVEVPLNP